MLGIFRLINHPFHEMCPRMTFMHDVTIFIFPDTPCDALMDDHYHTVIRSFQKLLLSLSK